MIIYVVILILFIVLSYKYDYKNKVIGYNKWINICLVILILLAALRNRVGGDTINYQLRFDEWPNLFELINSKIDLSEQSQSLWFLLNCMLKTIVDDFVVVQFFHAIVFNVLLFRFITKTTEKRFTAIMFTYCIVWWNFNFEVLRESLCIAIYLNSLLYLKENKIKQYFLINIPCFFIHYYSFVMIGITFVIYFMNKRTLSTAIFILTCLFIFSNNETLINSLMNLSLTISDETTEFLVSEDMIEKAEEYLEGDVYGATSLNLFGILVQMVGVTFPFIVAYNLRFSEEKQLFEKLLWLYILLFIIKSKFPIFSRFENYLLIPLIIETVNYINSKRLSHRIPKNVVIVLFVYLSIRTVIEFYLPPQSLINNHSYDCRYFPYTTIFEEPDKLRELYYGK